eukprot:11218085-Lingulodinium_polyedra.AAC.1
MVDVLRNVNTCVVSVGARMPGRTRARVGIGMRARVGTRTSRNVPAHVGDGTRRNVFCTTARQLAKSMRV